MKRGFAFRMSARGKKAGKEGSWGAVRVILPYFKRYVPRLVLGFTALIAVDFLQLLIPMVIRSAVDALQRGVATPSGLLKYGGYIIALAAVIAFCRFLWRIMLLGFSRLLETQLRNRMFSHLLTLDKAFFQRETAGEIMALATNDLSSVQLATGMGLVACVDAVFMGVASVAFMAYLNPKLAMIAIAPMPFLALLTRLLSARLHQRFKKVQEQFANLTEFCRATFSSIRLVKAYNQELSQAERFNELGETYVRDNLRLAAVYGTLFPVSAFVGNISMLAVLFFGGHMTIRGIITAGDFVAFITYLYMMTWPMMALGWVADLFQRGLTSLGRIEALLLEKPSLGDFQAPTDGPARSFNGDIRIRDLSFSYAGQAQPALKHVSLHIEPGAFLGVIGRTGAGKTTLCQLLTRFYPVRDSTIFIDDVDVNLIPLAAIREAIAYVPQDVTLFSDTIKFNITLGKPGATDEEVEAAAKAAAIHDEIMAMKDGYETRIGERGVKLSGGQRQRVAIARALILDRPIIVIDDGLSAVDMETEHAIVRSIASYLKDRTCIVVSHRIAPLADAQRIVVMDRGRILDLGTHEELVERCEFYATIYEQQTNTSRVFASAESI
jgi:ATP-binding cassette subfamily B multidrug efflux pump